MRAEARATRKSAWAAGALVACAVGCRALPPHTVVVVEDPNGLAGGAVAVRYGEELESLRSIELGSAALPFDFVLWGDQPRTAELWIDAVDAAGAVLGRGRRQVELRAGTSGVAAVDLAYVCDGERPVEERCALSSETAGRAYLGICRAAGNCAPSECGDGMVDPAATPSEECDDADEDTSDACPADCRSAACGDRHIWASDGGHETCDDGNDATGDGCYACAIEHFGPPTSLSGSGTTRAEDHPHVAAAGGGRWLAVWTAQGVAPSATFQDVMLASSSNDGTSWSPKARLNAGDAEGRDAHVYHLGGTSWAAAWMSGEFASEDLTQVAVSDNDGVSWVERPVLDVFEEDLEVGIIVHDPLLLLTPSQWTMMAVSALTLAGVGPDPEILAITSDDAGVSWSPPRAIRPDAGSEVSWENHFSVQQNGATVVAVWDADDPGGGYINGVTDVYVARSGDGGETWGTPALVDPVRAAADANAHSPCLAHDGAGTWLVVWSARDVESGPLGSDADLLYSVSRDDALSWSPPSALDPVAGTDTGDDTAPSVALDAAGRAVVAWVSTDSRANRWSTFPHVFYATSTDGAAGWSHAIPVDPVAAAAPGGDDRPFVATDGADHWVIVWQGAATAAAETQVFAAAGQLD